MMGGSGWVMCREVMGKKLAMRDKVGNRDAMIRPSAMMDG
jgi:hypothetical protein